MFAQFQWGLPDRTPRMIITDQPRQFAGNPQLLSWIQQHHAGLIVIGNSEASASAHDFRVDIVLPRDTVGREVAIAIELVGTLCDQRQKLAHEREECERWIDLAMHDSLTRLPNRRAWDKHFAESLAGRQSLCVGLIDVDLFKQVNDREGHNVGDAVLRETGRVLRAHLRSSDFVARLGGDEFGVILREVDTVQANSILDRIRRAMSAELTRHNLPCPTLSAGFTHVPASASREASSIFAATAAALQAAKHQHRHYIATPTR